MNKIQITHGKEEMSAEEMINVLKSYTATCPLKEYNAISFEDGNFFCVPKSSRKPWNVMHAGDLIEDYVMDIIEKTA